MLNEKCSSCAVSADRRARAVAGIAGGHAVDHGRVHPGGPTGPTGMVWMRSKSPPNCERSSVATMDELLTGREGS